MEVWPSGPYSAYTPGPSTEMVTFLASGDDQESDTSGSPPEQSTVDGTSYFLIAGAPEPDPPPLLEPLPLEPPLPPVPLLEAPESPPDAPAGADVVVLLLVVAGDVVVADLESELHPTMTSASASPAAQPMRVRVRRKFMPLLPMIDPFHGGA